MQHLGMTALGFAATTVCAAAACYIGRFGTWLFIQHATDKVAPMKSGLVFGLIVIGLAVLVAYMGASICSTYPFTSLFGSDTSVAAWPGTVVTAFVVLVFVTWKIRVSKPGQFLGLDFNTIHGYLVGVKPPARLS